MTDSSKVITLKKGKKKLIDSNFSNLKKVGLNSSILIPYVMEIEHIQSILPKPHEEHILSLQNEIKDIYKKVTGDSEDLDSYDGESVYEGGSIDDGGGDSDLESESSDSESSSDDSIYGGSVYGSDDEEEDDENFEGGFINQNGGEKTTDLVDLLVQKRLALKSIIFLHNYEKKWKTYIENQTVDKGKTYLDTLKIANIYLMKFGFCINANNIHMFNLIWECFQRIKENSRKKTATLYVIMYMANNNEKYKIFVRDFESETTSDKVMFYVLGVLYSSLIGVTGDESNEDEIKDAFEEKDWTSVDWSFNYINQIFWTVSMKGFDVKRNFLKSYLRFGFSTVAVIVSNNFNNHLGKGGSLIDFYLAGEYNFDDDSLTNLDESKCNSDLFSKLFLIFASLDFKQNNKDHIPFGLINHFTKTPSFVSWKPVRKMPILKYFKKLKFGSNKRRKNFTTYVKAKKELLFEEQMNDLILSVVHGPERLESDYDLKGGGVEGGLEKDPKKRRKQNEDMINLTAELDEKIRQVRSNDLDKLVTEMTKKEKARILKSMKIKPELLNYNNNKVISLKDIYNLGNIFLTQFLLELLMNHPSTQLIFDTQIINIRKNGYKEHKFKDGSDENMDKNLAIQNFSGKFMDKNGTLFLFFCCNKDESSKGLSKYQKSLHLFQTLKKNVSLKNYFHEPNIHLAVKIMTTEKSGNSMKNKIDSFPLQVIRLKNPYIFDTGSWLNPGLQLFFRSSNAKEKIKAEKEATRLQVKINQKKYKKNKNSIKRQKKIDKLEDDNLVLIVKIDAARKSGKTLKMTNLKRKLKNNKRQLRKMKKKMKEEEKDADDEIKELHDLRLQIVDRLNRFTRPMEDSVSISDEGAEKDYTASGLTMKKKGKKIDSPAEEDIVLRPDNPIYGIANAGNTCFFASILQVLFSIPNFGTLLDKSIENVNKYPNGCNELLGVVKSIHDKTMSGEENKVIQKSDYFERVKKIKESVDVTWDWIKKWGAQNDSGEMLGSLVGECMEKEFKTSEDTFTMYQNDKVLHFIPYEQRNVIPLRIVGGNDFDGLDQITCQDVLDILKPKTIGKNIITFHKKFEDMIRDYNKERNPENKKINFFKISNNKSWDRMRFGMAHEIIRFLVSLFSRYGKLMEENVLSDGDEKIFKQFFTTTNLVESELKKVLLSLNEVYEQNAKLLLDEKVTELKFDFDGNGEIIDPKTKEKKSVQINKKELEDRVAAIDGSNVELKAILDKFKPQLITAHVELNGLLERISVNADYTRFNNTPYLFIHPQLTSVGGSGKRTDLSSKFKYPDTKNAAFDYNEKKYKLIGISYHSGDGGRAGHYVAEVLRDGKLYLCSDSITSEIHKWNSYEGKFLVPSVFLFQEMAAKGGGRKTKKRRNTGKRRTKRRRNR